MENNLDYLMIYRSSYNAPQDAHANLENILGEIESYNEPSDIGILNSWLQRLKDIITQEGARKFSELANKGQLPLFTSQEGKVITAIDIIIGFASLDPEVIIPKDTLLSLKDIIVSFLKEDVIAILNKEKTT